MEGGVTSVGQERHEVSTGVYVSTLLSTLSHPRTEQGIQPASHFMYQQQEIEYVLVIGELLV